MAEPIIISLILAFLLISSTTHYVKSIEEQQGFISVDISNKGLNFAKNLLIETAESSLVPLELPDIKESVDIPFVGKVEMILSEIVINKIDVVSSTVKSGDSGIVIAVSGATANLTMNWKYSYKTWLFTLSDSGDAYIQVEGMDIGLTLSLQNQQGSLSLSLLDCGCYVDDISITLNGGASWLYQGLLDAFGDIIISAVEDAVSKRIGDGVVQLNSVLQSLPKEIEITKVAALNISFVGDPVISNSSVVLAINGLLSDTDENILLKHYHDGYILPVIPYNDPDEMITVFLHENVIKSVLSVYFKAGKMHWIVDQVPDQSLLNTAEWRFIIPKLYKLYPNDDMSLDISVSSVPTIKIEKQQIYAKVPADVIINVLHEGEVVPVACISVLQEVSGYASAEISSGTLAGSVKLDHYTMSLKWSKIGNLHLFLVQTLTSTLLRTVVLPLVNLRLEQGYHLPAYHGYELQNTEIIFSDSWITIYSNVNLTASPSLPQVPFVI